MAEFIFADFTGTDRDIVRAYTGSIKRPPDLTMLGANGEPYLYRWHVVPKNKRANIYFHLQVANDPSRPLHDRPWGTTTVVLAGSYIEVQATAPGLGGTYEVTRRVGGIINEPASLAHKMWLAPGVPYAMNLELTGPHIRDWGFWINKKWVSHTECVRTMPGNLSVYKESHHDRASI